MRESVQRGEDLGLSDDELAFYDALAQNASAIQVHVLNETLNQNDALAKNESDIHVMGVDEIKVNATELVLNVRQSVSIDWTIRESARAKIRVMVRRILRRHDYPPDLQAEATKLVLEQAEALCSEWAGEE